MSHPDKVLVAYDGSKNAEAALRDFTLSGFGPKTEVKILFIAEMWSVTNVALYDGSSGMPTTLFSQSLEQEKAGLKHAKAMVEIAAKQLRQLFPTWKITAEANLDIPANGILEVAKKWKATVIVLGSLGHSTLGRILLGSVSHKVLNHAHCSVRIVRPNSKKTVSSPRILIGIDGSKDSDLALRHVAKRFWPDNAQFKIVTVLDYRISLAEAFQKQKGKKISLKLHGQPFYGNFAEYLAERGQSLLAEKGLKVEAEVREGDPRQILNEEAKKFKATSLILGCRGLGSLQRFFLGSVSLNLAERATCTVEVVRH